MWLVVLYEGSDRDEFVNWMKSNNHVFKEYDNIPLLFEVEEPFDHPMIETIEGSDWVQVHPDARQTIQVNTNIYTGPDNWSLARIIRRDLPWFVYDRNHDGITSFYEAGLDGEGVDVYVIDSGFNVDHDEITGRATNVANFVADANNFDEFGHGTACASCAAGSTMGAARAALLWSFRVFGVGGGGATNGVVANAINAAIAHYNDRVALNRPAVMNLSLSSNGASSTGTAAAAAVAAGIVVIASAGNEKVSVSAVNVQPANIEGVICIGGANANDGPYYSGAFGSNWGSKVDVLAPSQGNRVADYTGNSLYKSGNGTSYGCAIATGLVACLLTGKGRLTSAQVAEVRQYLIDTATTGKVKPGPLDGSLPDRLIYMDPKLTQSPFSFISPNPAGDDQDLEGTIVNNGVVDGYMDVGEDVTDVRFLMLGASITDSAFGDGSSLKALIETDYAVNVDVENEGVSGWDSTDLKNAIDGILATYDTSKPTYCIIHIGGNDVTASRPYSTATELEKSTLSSNIAYILDAIRAKGFHGILSELSFRDYDDTTISNEENGSLPYNVNLIRPLIPQKWRNEDGTAVLSFYDLIKDNYATYLQSDNVHLTTAGNTAWRQHVADILGPRLFAGHEVGEITAPVVFVAGGTISYQNSGTSTTGAVPAGTAIGDLLIAGVFASSATVTPPAGWTLVDVSDSFTGGGFTRYVHVYKKVATVGGAASESWSQGSSGRLGVHVSAYRHADGATPIDVLALAKGTTALGANSVNIPALSFAENGMGVVLGGSIYVTSPAGALREVTVSAGWTLSSPADVAENRLGVAHRPYLTGDTASGTMTFETDSTSNRIGALTLHLGVV